MKLLVVIDYQNDFITGALANPAAVPLEKGIAELCGEFLQNDKVLFTRDTHEHNYLLTREGNFLPVAHCIKNTEGWQLAKDLLPLSGNKNAIIADKPTFGCAGIAQKALELCGGEPCEIHICGVVTDICVVSNAIMLHSAFLNAKCVLHENLCAAATNEGHNRAVTLLKGLGWEIV